MVIVISHISGHRRVWCVNQNATVSDVLEVLLEKEGSIKDVVLQCQGQILTAGSPLSSDASVVASLKLHGGKGGFGSMLRAIGAQIEKTTNREACRDLSGRRLRDINEEKRLKDFISKKAEREREMQDRKRQKFEKLKETPRHVFQDESYYQQREVREKNLFDSLDKAFKNGSSSGVKKRSCEGDNAPIKRIKKNKFMDDLDESSDESEDDSSDSAEKTSEDTKTSSEDECHKPANSISKASSISVEVTTNGKETDDCKEEICS